LPVRVGSVRNCLSVLSWRGPALVEANPVCIMSAIAAMRARVRSIIELYIRFRAGYPDC
jgi:hypothetical protein